MTRTALGHRTSRLALSVYAHMPDPALREAMGRMDGLLRPRDTGPAASAAGKATNAPRRTRPDSETGDSEGSRDPDCQHFRLVAVPRLTVTGRTAAIAPRDLATLRVRYQRGESLPALAREASVSHETLRRVLVRSVNSAAQASA